MSLFCNGISGIDEKINGKTGSKVTVDIGISEVKKEDICDVKCHDVGLYVRNLSKLCCENLTYRPTS